jgi:hypothetical protein
MPNLTDYAGAKVTKMLVVADSGAGKTGALASLARAGYNLRILDYDSGLNVLVDLLKSDPQALARIEYETLTDSMKNVSGKLIPKSATVWQRTSKILDNWSPPNASAKLGPITSWGPQDILIIDSLSFLAKGAMDWILAMNGRLGAQPHQSDWYSGQQLLEQLMQLLFDEGVKCNVIVNCHITYIGEENGPVKGYPATLGKALSPKIGSYFNTVLRIKTSGVGQSRQRKIFTKTSDIVELKTASPTSVKAEYSIETGLAEYFADERRGRPSASVTESTLSPKS